MIEKIFSWRNPGEMLPGRRTAETFHALDFGRLSAQRAQRHRELDHRTGIAEDLEPNDFERIIGQRFAFAPVHGLFAGGRQIKRALGRKCFAGISLHPFSGPAEHKNIVGDNYKIVFFRTMLESRHNDGECQKKYQGSFHGQFVKKVLSWYAMLCRRQACTNGYIAKVKKMRHLSSEFPKRFYLHLMLDSSLVETLSRFQSAELERFRKFVYSPFFHEGSYARDTTQLMEYLLPFAPGFAPPGPTVEGAFAYIYPDKKFVKGKVEVLMSKLHQLAKQFAAHLTGSFFDVPEPLLLAQFFLDRDLPNRAVPLLEKMRTEQAARHIHDVTHWAERFLTEWQTHRLDTLRQNNHAHESLNETIYALHHGYLTLALDLLNNLFFSRRKSNVEDNFAEQVAAGIPAAIAISDLASEPVLRLLSKGFEFVRHPENHDQASIEQVLDDLQRNSGHIPRNVARTLFTYLRNHCTWRYNHGETAYAPLLMALFKSGLENGLLFDDGQHIHASTLLNMVQTGLVSREFDWVKNALEHCRNRVTGVPNPVEFFHYNLANYYYHTGNHDKALSLLNDSSDHLFSGLMARKLELKIYYETDSPLMDSKMDSFKLFIFRQGKKNLAPNVFQMNNAFIDMLRRMISTGVTGNSERIEKLRKQLNDMELVAERAWLHEQLDRLGG